MTARTTSRRRLYNSTGHRYESGRYGDPHMESYRAFRDDTLLGILKGGFSDRQVRLLEVGCGTGLTLDYLARQSNQYSLYGIDASDTMLKQASQKASGRGNRPKLALGDASRLPFEPCLFDVVIATRFIHQFPHETKRRLWQEFERVTRPGGLMVVEFYARPYHWFRYYLGARKGRSRDGYFLHYPSRAQVREIVGDVFHIYPLRLPGSRLIAGALGERVVRRATTIGGHLAGGVLLDEYFLVARKR